LYAIVVTNIYLSAGGRDASMRDDHDPNFHPLGRQDATHRNPGAFARRFSDELWQFRHDMPDFFLELARVNCLYNPLRFWFQVDKEEEARRKKAAS
jgi:hypothetical protein